MRVGLDAHPNTYKRLINNYLHCTTNDRTVAAVAKEGQIFDQKA